MTHNKENLVIIIKYIFRSDFANLMKINLNFKTYHGGYQAELHDARMEGIGA